MSPRIAICFGQFAPYIHARVAALQKAFQLQEGEVGGVKNSATGGIVLPVQIAAVSETYAWNRGNVTCAGLTTLCKGSDERASPIKVFFKARKLFKKHRINVVFVPSYSPLRYLSFTIAAKSLGIRTVMMNESHAGTEKATGWKKWIKRQIVKRFDAALVGGAPQKRHFAALGIPAEKIFTGYDAVDNDFFASRADQIRAAAK